MAPQKMESPFEQKPKNPGADDGGEDFRHDFNR
jgi:hypothetical protein